MKKQFFVLACLIYLSQAIAQTVIPQTIPCITITQSNVVGLGSGITATDCIETDGNLTFLQYENYSIKAGEYISFGQNTSINPDASHQFHAYIDNGGMEIGWYYPNETPGTVGQFEKLELGVEFRDDIDQLVENFTANTQVSPNLNPFNPEKIDLYAEFWWYSDGSNPFIPAGWHGPQKINGFYYEEYERGSTDWLQQNNQHDFRIRFAPRILGLWRCKITAHVQGFGTFTASEFTFNCVDSDSKDFMSVGENGRYFKMGDEPFFPVGHNVVWPREPIGTAPNPRSYSFINPPSFYLAYHEQMNKIIANGGNYMRFINSPWATDCEFEELNDYSDRMVHTWELDKILEHADSLDLRIHFDLQIQYNFDAPDGFGYFQWDWTATGDPYNNGATCVAANDSGYCYRSELGIIEPIEFFTNADARKFYKYKLRYLIARYGYSNEIALIELFSEINNAGSKRNMELVSGGCYAQEGSEIRPYDADPTVPQKMYEWQHEMCQYIKTVLQHTNHPLAVSYGGPPDFGSLTPLQPGDLTYLSEYVDINTYNHYSLSVEKNYKSVEVVTDLTYTFDRPFMFSEYGSGGGEENCDDGVDFIKTLVLSPFYGTAGAAMNWDWQYPGQEFLWHHMGPVNQLMSGIPLDEENWQVGVPLVAEDKEVEVLYLYGPQNSNNQRKVVGAVSNRTYNYYTQGSVAPCNVQGTELQNPENAVYLEAQSFAYSTLSSALKIPDMGFLKDYSIDWYDALTGNFWQTTSESSGINGNLDLHYPGVITGSGEAPILFFTISPSGVQFKSNESTNEEISATTMQLHLDTTVSSVIPTKWTYELEENATPKQVDLIKITPNPTDAIVNIFVDESLIGSNWILTDDAGNSILTGLLTNSNLVLDLAVYANGIYYITFYTEKMKYASKIIKS